MEPKPFASLSSGLLARKGAARPAMRPQGFGQVAGNLEDLGWNDMGFEPPKPASSPRDETHDGFGDDIVEHPRSAHPTGLTPIGSPVHTQQAEIEDRLKSDDDAEIEGHLNTEDDAGIEDRLNAEDDAGIEDRLNTDDEAIEDRLKTEDEAGIKDHLKTDDSDEEFDETAEPYDPEAQPEVVLPTLVPVAASVLHSVPKRAPKSRAAPGSKDKAAFTLRLDKERHLKLRLACAVDGRSAQQIVTAALDQLLAQMPELGTLAAKAKRKG